jgi:hypothetical protein
MFNFFKKTPPKEITPEAVSEIPIEGAAITFFVEDGEPRVDIALTDYKEASIEGMATILGGLIGCTFFNATMEMVKDGFLAEENPEDLLRMIAILETLEPLNKKSKEGEKEEPCIKPQDAI